MQKQKAYWVGGLFAEYAFTAMKGFLLAYGEV
jgi:hypothetical protein